MQMKLTRELIEDGRTPAGAFTLHQVTLLGIKLPAPGTWPRTGWIDRAVGTEISEKDYAAFLHEGSMTPQQRRAVRKEAKKTAGVVAHPQLFEL